MILARDNYLNKNLLFQIITIAFLNTQLTLKNLKRIMRNIFFYLKINFKLFLWMLFHKSYFELIQKYNFCIF